MKKRDIDIFCDEKFPTLGLTENDKKYLIKTKRFEMWKAFRDFKIAMSSIAMSSIALPTAEQAAKRLNRAMTLIGKAYEKRNKTK